MFIVYVWPFFPPEIKWKCSSSSSLRRSEEIKIKNEKCLRSEEGFPFDHHPFMYIEEEYKSILFGKKGKQRSRGE